LQQQVSVRLPPDASVESNSLYNEMHSRAWWESGIMDHDGTRELERQVRTCGRSYPCITTLNAFCRHRFYGKAGDGGTPIYHCCRDSSSGCEAFFKQAGFHCFFI